MQPTSQPARSGLASKTGPPGYIYPPGSKRDRAHIPALSTPRAAVSSFELWD